ncbi:MAG: hypothetical protein EPO68_14150 [Planctomycetota bacterium]|nr:MAG: hypothetical protein EPO68_14150 [Planctomycetota bacterium]
MKPGIFGDLRTVGRWDPDGAGPAHELVVYSGSFSLAGGIGGLALAIVGFRPSSVPLSSLVAEGQPGCDLLVSLDILRSAPIVNGMSAFQMAAPNDPAIVGFAALHQMLPFEIDAQGLGVAQTATNALQVTLGAF